MNRDTFYALLMVALTIIALGLAGHEDYSAQLILDEAPPAVVVADGGPQ